MSSSLARHGRLLVEGTRQKQRRRIVEGHHRPQRLKRRVRRAARANEHGFRIRHFDLGAQHIEPRGTAGIEACLRQPMLMLGPPQALLGHRDALLLQERAVVGLHHLQRQRLPRTLELVLRRGRLRLRGGQACCSRPPV